MIPSPVSVLALFNKMLAEIRYPLHQLFRVISFLLKRSTARKINKLL